MRRNQKLLLPSELEPVTESSESGALSLSSAARHIDFYRFCSAFHSAFTKNENTLYNFTKLLAKLRGL